MAEVPETQTIQLNADGPLDSEMPALLRAAIRRARKGGITKLLDGDMPVAEIVPALQIVTVLAPHLPAGQTAELEHALERAFGRNPHLPVERAEVAGFADFRGALEALINEHTRENFSNTPDFILAGFLETCLKAFESAVRYRDDWYGVHLSPGDSYFVGEPGVQQPESTAEERKPPA